MGVAALLWWGWTAASSDQTARPGTIPSASSPTPSAPSTSSPTPSAPTSGAPASGPAASGPAVDALARLAVKGRAPKTGYSREQFGQAWRDTDRNGCDQRNDVLRRDLQGTTTKPGTGGCVVLTGVLISPYSADRVAFERGQTSSALVPIDHVVALSDAWQKGAQQWTEQRREEFANDFLELVATDRTTNSAKSDKDAATWLPPARGARCEYVARQIAVKAEYGLWVTGAERDAMRRVLARCPAQRLPADRAVQPVPR